MHQEQILTILYDMTLVIGAEDKVAPLLKNTLKRLIYHTGYPVGLFLTDVPGTSNKPKSSHVHLAMAIGDYLANTQIGKEITVPVHLLTGPAQQFVPDAQMLQTLPLRQDYYHCCLCLPVPGQGIILLLSPEQGSNEVPFASIFQPVMDNLAKSIRLCQTNENYTKGLINDRDQARSANERFRSAMDASLDCIFLIDPVEMRFVDFNHTAETVLGYSHNELGRLGPQDIKPEISKKRLKSIFSKLLDGPGSEFGELTTLHQRRDGTTFPVELRLSVLTQNAQPLVIAVARDISERKQAEASLFAEKERAQVTLDSIGDGVITTDPAGYIDYLNPVAESLTGWSNAEAVGLPLDEVFRITNETTGEPLPSPVELCLREKRIIGLTNHTILSNRQNQPIAIEDSAAPIRDSNGEIVGVVLVFHDVSKAREMARKLTWQASHDALTALYNRREFERQLEQAFDDSRHSGIPHTLLYIDLDQFKIINDTCGHIAGDQMLKQLTAYLQRSIRANDSLARLGGDEFGVLLYNCDINNAYHIAGNIRDVISDFTFVWEDKSFKVGASIGMVELNELLESPAQVMSNADVACYAAKDQGGNRIHAYQPDDHEVARRQSEMHWVAKINHALEHNRLTLFAQPICSLDEHNALPTYYELLIRMYDDEGELIEPGRFIPAAERYRLMYKIDCWVIHEAIKHHAGLASEHQDTLFTINLSGFSLTQEGLLNFIRTQFQQYQTDPACFCFEITETAAISNIGFALDFIQKLKAIGCTFALDDFGSGLSSFNYLKNLPVDFLKIDGSFVLDILDDPADAGLVDAINRIGHDLGLKTIAEFVENNAIANKLREMGVDYAQGFGISRPIPLSSLHQGDSVSSLTMITASSRPLGDG